MLNFSTSIEQFTEQLSLEALGLNLNKKTVAIVSAYNELSVSNSGLDKICEQVKKGILSKDFNAITFNLPNLCSDLTMGSEANKYVLPLRDNIADSVEMLASFQAIDGFVFVANDAATVAGMIIGCMRVNVPSLFIGGGTMKTALIGDKKMGFYSAYETRGLLKSGKINLTDLEKIQHDLIQGNGNASDNYPSNSSLVIAEAMGLALPRASTLPADDKSRFELAEKTGETICTMIKNLMTPRSIASAESIKTAACVDIALGSSSTSVINLIAISHETGNDIDFSYFDELSKSVPRIVNISTRQQYFMEDFDSAGGVYAVIKQLVTCGKVDGIYKIFDGTLMRDNIDNMEFEQSDVIKNMSKQKKNSFTVMYGNIAEEGAIGFFNEVESFSGPARVFENEETALDAISAKVVKPGDVVVIRNEGPVSGPGMRIVYLPLSMLVGLDLDKKVAVITDGRIPDISRGIAIGCVNKETADKDGVLDVIKNGDIIEINMTKRRVNVKLNARDIAVRKKYVEPNIPEVGAFLKKYSKTVSPSNQGCITGVDKKQSE